MSNASNKYDVAAVVVMGALVVGAGCNVSSETMSSTVVDAADADSGVVAFCSETIVSAVCDNNAVVSETGCEFDGTTSCPSESCSASDAEDCEPTPSVGALTEEDSFDASSSSAIAPMTLSVKRTPIAIATEFFFDFSFGFSSSTDNGSKGVSGLGSAGGSVSAAVDVSVTTSPVATWT